MENRKEGHEPEILEEKQIFYLAEFREEAAWLSFMHRQGWKFLSTTGRRYRFEACPAEDWVYQLDFKEDGVADEDYIQMFIDYGWEYVFQYGEWFYFRKLRSRDPYPDAAGAAASDDHAAEAAAADTAATSADDLSIFSDNQSKIEMCRRIIRRNFLRITPLYICILLYDYLVFGTGFLEMGGFIGGLLQGVAVAAMLVIVAGLGFFLGQYNRLQKIIKDLENPVQD